MIASCRHSTGPGTLPRDHPEEAMKPTTSPAEPLCTSRRTFLGRSAACCGGITLLFSRRSFAAPSPAAAPAATPSRPDVASIDRSRILAAADRYLGLPPTPLTSLPCPRSLGTAHDYYSEADPDMDYDTATGDGEGPAEAKKAKTEPLFTAHRDALFQLGLAVPALSAAYLLTAEDRYAQHAILHLRAWFVDPATRMSPRLDYGHVVLKPALPADQVDPYAVTSSAQHPAGSFEGILETLPLVEVAISIPFLSASPGFTADDRSSVHAWFAAYLQWLINPEDSGPRLPALARDQKDHHATSWLLQTSAYSWLAVPAGDAARAEDSALAHLRHRFRTITLRAQIKYDGTFPHELDSPNPYRNSLFNLDMLAGICQLLSTRFEGVWDYELDDGPGMRSAIAYHFPFIANRATWPFRADATDFDLLPLRRASLLLSARAYDRPEYAALWMRLNPGPAPPEILRTLPIKQPLLWISGPSKV